MTRFSRYYLEERSEKLFFVSFTCLAELTGSLDTACHGADSCQVLHQEQAKILQIKEVFFNLMLAMTCSFLAKS